MISRNQLEVLALLTALDHATAETLAKQLGLPVKQVDQLLTKLEDTGLVVGDLVH